MKLIVQEDFSWAHRHVDIKSYAAGDEIETDDADLIAVAIEEGWASDAEGEPKKRSKKSAPENKAESAAPEQQ